MESWRLIVPAEDWQHPIEIREPVEDPVEWALSLLTKVGERLNLRVNRDEQNKKFYLGEGPAPKPEVAGGGEGVKYPSGLSIPKAVLSVAEAARYGTTGIYTAAPLLAARPTDRLSEHFTAAEFMCHDTSYRFVRVAPELVKRLEKIRTALGNVAITVSSGYRPPGHNESVGGASQSTHIDGLAADISAAGVSTEALFKVCKDVIGNDGGVAYYPVDQFCHVDVRGYASRW